MRMFRISAPSPEGFVQIPQCLCYRFPFGKIYPNCDIQCARTVEDIFLKEGSESEGGKSLFCGLESVADKREKQPPSEAQVGAVVDAVKAEGVLIGRTNSSPSDLNTTLYFAPALVITKKEADRMVDATQKGIEKVFG